MSNDENSFDAELQALLAQNRKIEAIKLYRERTGTGLKEAKDAVEALVRGESLPSRESVDLPFEGEVVWLLEQGRKIEAIKLYRENTGVGLKEAKDFIEALAADHRITVPSRSGCLGVVLFMIAIVFLLLVAPLAAEDQRPLDYRPF